MPTTATTAWSPSSATANLRNAAGTFDDQKEMFAGQSLADYLESTVFPDQWRLSQIKYVMAEMAMAYLAGYEQGSHVTHRARPRQLHRALRENGLTL